MKPPRTVEDREARSPVYNSEMLSSRARYATRALLELSLRYDEKACLIQEIAERQNIPLKFLQQILVSLKHAGYVQSRKGPGGGYALAKPPQQITLGNVIRAMDAQIAPISCVSVVNFHECGCPDPETCPLKVKFKEVRDAMSEILDNTTFAELRTLQLAADRRPSALDFVI